MFGEAGQLGIWPLRLLAERMTVRVLLELVDGPLQPSDLEQRLPQAAHSGLLRQLGGLGRMGALARKRVVAVPPRAYYELTDAGLALLPIAEAAEQWERRWGLLAETDIAGRWAMGLLAHENTRAMLLALSEQPLRPIDLDGANLSRSATRRRLGYLLRNGILTRSQNGSEVRYELTASARDLGHVATLAARWEWQWGYSCQHPRSSSERPLQTLEHSDHP